MTYYTCRESKHGLFAVGSYDEWDEWNPESDHDSAESAMTRTNFLNARAKRVTDCRTKVLELLAELKQYDAEILVSDTPTKMAWSGSVTQWQVVMGAEATVVFSQIELYEDY